MTDSIDLRDRATNIDICRKKNRGLKLQIRIVGERVGGE
jgi:hypothetical protein